MLGRSPMYICALFLRKGYCLISYLINHFSVSNSWVVLFQVLFFSTMTRLLDVMEDYLTFKQYRYLRLDGHTCGGDRGALIDKFNQQDSPFFIFLLRLFFIP